MKASDFGVGNRQAFFAHIGLNVMRPALFSTQITIGATGGLFSSLQAFVNPGDEVRFHLNLHMTPVRKQP